MSMTVMSTASTSVGGAGLGGGGTGVSTGFAAVTGGRASCAVVGVFFAHAPEKARPVRTINAAMVSVVSRLVMSYSLARGRAKNRERGCPKINIAKSLRKRIRSRHPERLEVIRAVRQLPLVLPVGVDGVDLRRSVAPRGVGNLLPIRGPAGVSVGAVRGHLDRLAGDEVHDADVEVALVAARERDLRAVRRPRALVVPVAGEREPARARALRVHHVDLRRAGQVGGVQDLAA